jgi:hypothetical protein
MAHLTFQGRLIHECADPNGQHDATRNQIHASSDPGNDRLAVRRLGSDVARRLDTMSTFVSRDGGAHRARRPDSEIHSVSGSLAEEQP